MKVTKDINLREFEAWSGAKDTLKAIGHHNEFSRVEEYINELMPEATETDINDFLWFEDEFIAEELLSMDIDDFYSKD